MRPIDIILIAVIAAVLVFAVVLAVRRKKTSPCCGNCAECMKKQGADGCGNTPARKQNT
ncbi:MAG: FeoB-associated Cys-rich membrane protein [Lachnospiraceae bacterium]|nr:FeoB-associated Cys-rich membrane protein [Lachnospiraceae bacterium]